VIAVDGCVGGDGDGDDSSGGSHGQQLRHFVMYEVSILAMLARKRMHALQEKKASKKIERR
jgi:hypothetical protein